MVKKDDELILVAKELREKEKQLKLREEEQNRKDIYLKEYRKKEKFKNYVKKLRENGTLKKYRAKYESSSKYIFFLKKFRKTDNFLIPHKIRQAKRRADKLNATPKWANLKEIEKIYKNCPKGFHVDHIIPLISDKVCGLHVENNLRTIPAEENISKGNKLIQSLL